MIDLAATIEAMKASGMTSDEIVRALACVQSVAPTSSRTPRQERNHRYYLKASEKRLKASEQDVSDADVTIEKEAPHTPEEKQEPPKENTPLRGVQKKRGHRLPSDFTMPDDWRHWAIQRGLPAERVPVEFEKMTNWAANAPDSKGAKADWFKAWKNWVIGAIDALPRVRAGPQLVVSKPTLAGGFGRLAEEMAEKQNAVRSGESGGSVQALIPDLSAVSGR